MQTGTIVSRRAGHFPPNAFWEACLAANPHGWGATVYKDGAFLVNTSDEGADIDLIQGTLKEFEECDITFQFVSSDTALSKVDIPPHILVVSKDEDDAEVPQILAFVDGNYTAYAKTGSSHPPEYHMVLEYLQPKVENIYDMLEGDLDKVFAQFEKPHFKKELILTSVSRGTITLVLANGKSITFHQGDLSAEYPWGWSSNTHGYATEAKKTEAAPAKKPSMFSPGTKSTVREKANVKPAIETAAAVKAPATDTAITQKYIVKRSAPPDNCTSRKDKKGWYGTRVGYLPQGWSDRVEIEYYVEPNTGKLLTFAQAKGLGLGAAGLPALKNPPRVSEKDIDTDNIPEVNAEKANDKPVDKAVTTEKLPLMSPDTRKHIHAMLAKPEVKKLIAENAQIVEDPKVVAALEAKFVDFAKQLGLKSIDEFLMWDYGMFLDLGTTKPEGLAVMAWSFRNIIAYHRTKKAEKEVVSEAPTQKAKRPSMFATG